MQFSKLERQYEEILESSRERGEIFGGSEALEQRRHPRMSVDSSELVISAAPEFVMLNMSLSGMAFHSNHPLEEGAIIHITLGSMLSVDAHVLSCKLEEAPSVFVDAQFRINCEFLQDTKAMELLVSLKGNFN